MTFRELQSSWLYKILWSLLFTAFVNNLLWTSCSVLWDEQASAVNQAETDLQDNLKTKGWGSDKLLCLHCCHSLHHLHHRSHHDHFWSSCLQWLLAKLAANMAHCKNYMILWNTNTPSFADRGLWSSDLVPCNFLQWQWKCYSGLTLKGRVYCIDFGQHLVQCW